LSKFARVLYICFVPYGVGFLLYMFDNFCFRVVSVGSDQSQYWGLAGILHLLLFLSCFDLLEHGPSGLLCCGLEISRFLYVSVWMSHLLANQMHQPCIIDRDVVRTIRSVAAVI